jgi:hypothetical protein
VAIQNRIGGVKDVGISRKKRLGAFRSTAGERQKDGLEISKEKAMKRSELKEERIGGAEIAVAVKAPPEPPATKYYTPLPERLADTGRCPLFAEIDINGKVGVSVEFIVSLGMTAFLAGIVFGILKTQIGYLEDELKEERAAAKNAIDRLEKNLIEKHKDSKDLCQSLKERIDKNDKAIADMSDSLIAIT